MQTVGVRSRCPQMWKEGCRRICVLKRGNANTYVVWPPSRALRAYDGAR